MLAEPVKVPFVATMLVLPWLTLCAKPPPLTVATAVADELQLDELVRSFVLPSVYVPIAANCWDLPSGTDAVDGLTDSETSTGAVTVSEAEPLMVPKVAVMVELP